MDGRGKGSLDADGDAREQFSLASPAATATQIGANRVRGTLTGQTVAGRPRPRGASISSTASLAQFSDAGHRMRYVLVGLAVLGALYCLHRIAVWAEGRGWIYYRKRQGSSGALGNAFLEVQANIDPSAKYVLEERMRDDLEEEESGDPPDPGKGNAVQHSAAADGASRRR